MKRVFLCVVLIAWSGVASAVVYKWVDAQGKVQYGDSPPDGVHAEVVELLGNHAPRSDTPPTPTATASRPVDKPEAKSAAKASVDADVAQTREKQCSDAQAQYRQLIEARRLYKEGPDGERQYLASDEIDSERVNAKRDIDAVCTSQN